MTKKRNAAVIRRVNLVCSAAALIACSSTLSAQVDPWAPPATYYNAATGTGATLKSQLYNIMKTGHIQRTYGDFRFSAAIHDRDPSNASRILCVYNRLSVPSTWDSGATWNREHIWPQSRQPGSASNSSTGNIGDPHALRPSDPSTNSSRSNDPYGFATTTGNARSLGGSTFFPGDTDKGDIARQLFYSDTRWGPDLGISLTNSAPSGNQMAYLSALIAWNYLDPPNEFERRRNHTIYSSNYNPSYYTNNRNAFIDHPEYVWSIYVDQQNDSQLFFAPGPDDPAGGSLRGYSVVTIVGPTTVLSQTVELNKTGFDGTYYSVTATGNATASPTGRFNVFPMSSGATESRNISVGLTLPANQPGSYQGLVTIDNLDVTVGGPFGHGGTDDDDVVSMLAQVLDHANGSFDAGADVNSIDVDLGSIDAGDGDLTIDIPVHNLVDAPGFTAKLDIEFGSGLGDTDALLIDSMLALSNISAGSSGNVQATLSDAATGSFDATYTLRTFDQRTAENWQEGAVLTIHLTGAVNTASTVGDMNCDGVVNFGDIGPFSLAMADATAYGSAYPACDINRGDLNGDTLVDGRDLAGFVGELLQP
ncbi:MAG: endonuclease [Phycisphaerales bacterium]|nr:endonuclease [Phycisphaerales bacterium]